MKMTVDTMVMVPLNQYPLIDDTDFKTRETAIAFDESGMDLVWNFTTSDGVRSQTAVTPTEGSDGDYDWVHEGDAMYSVEIPASGGASVSNDTEGFGWWSGVCDGVLPWAGPVVQFSPANVIDSMVDGSDRLEVDTKEINSVAQRAIDLAEIAQYFFANSATLTDIIANDSVIAQIMATSGLIANYSKVDDALQSIRDVEPHGTVMRGTDSAALASVLGALADAAADGDPTNTDTIMQYVKQLINILVGSSGIVTFPAEAAPGNGVSLAEVIRALHTDVTGINGDAMRGTDGANTTVPDAAGTAAGLHGTTDGLINGLNNITAASVWAVGSRTLTSFGTLVADTATAVWNKATSALTTASSIGKKLADWVLGNDDKVILSANAQTGVTIPTVTNVGTTAVNTDMRGTDSAATEAKQDVIDANVDAIKAKTDNLPTSPAAVGSEMALTDAAVDKIHDEVVEGTITLRQATRLFLAVLTGKTSGSGTPTIVFRDTGDTKNRLSITVDENNNRTAVGTRDGS